MWSATLHAVAHRSPLLTPAHVVEGVAGVAVVGWAALHGLVLVLGAPAAGDDAAARAASHRADVVLVDARTETVNPPTARGDDPGSRDASRVRVRWDRDGVVLAGAVLASRLVTWTALRLRGRRWARDWRVWDDRRDPAAPGHG